MNVIPLDDRILVRPFQAVSGHGRTNTTPDHTSNGPMRGTVIAAGTGIVGKEQSAALAVQAGDTILFGKYLGCEVTFGGMQYWMIKAADILKIEVRAVAVVLYGDKGRRL
jgi:chaperonin GroES